MNADISIYHAHSGQRISVKRHVFLSADELRKFCSKQLAIPLQRIFMLSSFGLLVRSTSIDELDDIYVFDKELFSVQGNEQLLKRYIDVQRQHSLDLIQPVVSPLLDVSLESVAQSRNSKQLISLLTTNLGWVAAIESDCALAVTKIKEIHAQINALFTSVNVATKYIESYCNNIKKTLDESIDFVGILQQASLNLKWREHYEALGKLQMVDRKPLSLLLNSDELKSVSEESHDIYESLNTQLLQSKPLVIECASQISAIDNDLKVSRASITQYSETHNFESPFKELSTMCSKVRSDTKSLLNKASTMDDLDVDIILETFQLHKTQHVAQIYTHSQTIYTTFQNFKELFIQLQYNLTGILQKLSKAQIGMIGVKEILPSIALQIEKVQSLESTLAHTVDLPLLYGLYIIENMRREVWLNQVVSVTSKTNEKLASLREREIKTRNQWVKNYGIVLQLLGLDQSVFNNNNLTTFEVIRTEDICKQSDKVFTHDDCVAFIHQLEANIIGKDTIGILIKTLHDVTSKPGPILSNMSSSMTPTDQKPGIDVLKGYKSRIKKLENLLHQQQFHSSLWPSHIGSSKLTSTFLSRHHSLSDSRRGSHDTQATSLLHPSRSPSPVHQSEAIERLELDNNELKIKLGTKESEVEQLADLFKAFKQDSASREFMQDNSLIEAQREMELQQVKINEISRKLADEEVKRIKVESLLDQKDKTIQELEARIKRQDEDLKKLGSQSEAMDAIRKELTEKNKAHHEITAKAADDLNLKACELEALRTKLCEEIDILTAQLDAKTEEVDELHTAHNEEQALLEKNFSEKLKLESEKFDCLKLAHDQDIKRQSESPYNEEQMSRFESDLTEFQNEIHFLKMKLAAKEKELTDKTEEWREVSKDFHDLQSASNIKINDLEARVQALLETKHTTSEQLTSNVAEIASYGSTINELSEALSELDSSSKTKVLSLESKITDLLDSNKKYEAQLEDWSEDFDRLKSMKNDLLENMANREDEFTKEKIAYQEELELLKTRIEDLETDEGLNEENLQLISRYRQLNFQLIIIVNSLVIKSRDLTEIIVGFYDLFLGTLKSLGLLAVMNNEGADIIRVKGLRKTNSDPMTVSSVADLSPGFRPVLKDDVLKKSLIWNDDSNFQKMLDACEDSSNEDFLSSLNELIVNKYNLISFEDKYLDFVQGVTNLNKIYLASVAKRFGEVENLAKKELKENRRLRAENLRPKLSVKDFKVGDLVLFLPTKMPLQNTEKDENQNQWAAFNDMGDCKFLMKNTNKVKLSVGKQWFIGRILEIEKASAKEFMLTTDEITL